MSCHVRTAVLKILIDKESIHTRLRETGRGDHHDVAPTPQAIQAMSLCAQEVVTVLEELERQGTVVRSTTVNPHDSAEYLMEWRGLETSVAV